MHLKVNLFGQITVEWPGLHNAVFITTYNKPYAATWVFQPLATGTAILVATIIVAALTRLSPRRPGQVIALTAAQVKLPLVTTMIIIGLAYLMNYSGIAYTLGVGIASVGLRSD